MLFRLQWMNCGKLLWEGIISNTQRQSSRFDAALERTPVAPEMFRTFVVVNEMNMDSYEINRNTRRGQCKVYINIWSVSCF